MSTAHSVSLHLPTEGLKDIILRNAVLFVFTFGALCGWPRPICEWLYEWKVTSSNGLIVKRSFALKNISFLFWLSFLGKCTSAHVILC